MRPVLRAEEMREADRLTIEEVGLPGSVLMENAGAAVAREIDARYPRVRRPLFICGRGNNGGDGFVAARRLLGRDPEVVLLGRREDVKGDAASHLKAFEASGGKIVEMADDAAFARVRERSSPPSLVVDAIFGTGLRDKPGGMDAAAIEQIAAWALAGSPVVAVDLPSGLFADSGACDSPCVLATVTVTFGAPKPAHVLSPSCDRVGELVVDDIGIPARVLGDVAPQLFLLEATDARRGFPPRAAGSNKGTFGHVLVIAGSSGKTGAAILAAIGALRAGAGLVTVGTPAGALPLVASARPELMTEPLADGLGGVLSAQAVKRALALARERDSVVLGPGLGLDAGTREFVRTFVPQCPVPLVVDADALNALTAGGSATGSFELIKRSHPTIVTPHPGEMARLASLDTAVVQGRRLETARDFARASGATVVLKGQRTVVCEKGGRAAINPTGNPGMATAGTGDVLAGVIGALLARHDTWMAATAGAYVHGLAGDRAAARRGEAGMVAGDLLEALPEAICTLGERTIPEHVTSGEAETAELGADLAAGLQGGEVVLLYGELGAGKTAFVRGMARGLGIAPDEVASPTFVLLASHPGRLILHHADLYRLHDGGDEREVGLEELPGPGGVLAVEWPERLGRVPWPEAFRVRLEHAGGDVRRVTIDGGPEGASQ